MTAPPDASEAIGRMVTRLRADGAGLSTLRLTTDAVQAHESGTRVPLVLVQQVIRAEDRRGVYRGVEIDVLAEVPRDGTGAYDPRRYLAAIHRWVYGRLSGHYVESAGGPLQHARQVLPLEVHSVPDTAQTDAERGSLFSIASYLLTLEPR